MVHRYPSEVKAFYMQPDPERPEVALCVDVLAPEGYGEIIGGGQRIHDYDLLMRRLKEHNLSIEPFPVVSGPAQVRDGASRRASGWESKEWWRGSAIWATCAKRLPSRARSTGFTPDAISNQNDPAAEPEDPAPDFCGRPGSLASVCFIYYYAHRLTIAHYDAKAHLLVARRIVDSLAPGYSQMGVNWLPLIHLLYLPFVIFESQYRSGFLPSLISVFAFALSGCLAYKISSALTGSMTAGVFAAIVLLANPNLQYLQSCPLTEPLYMVLFLLAMDSLIGWRDGWLHPVCRGARRSGRAWARSAATKAGIFWPA